MRKEIATAEIPGGEIEVTWIILDDDEYEDLLSLIGVELPHSRKNGSIDSFRQCGHIPPLVMNSVTVFLFDLYEVRTLHIAFMREGMDQYAISLWATAKRTEEKHLWN
jgi:hypothetical protein